MSGEGNGVGAGLGSGVGICGGLIEGVGIGEFETGGAGFFVGKDVVVQAPSHMTRARKIHSRFTSPTQAAVRLEYQVLDPLLRHHLLTEIHRINANWHP